MLCYPTTTHSWSVAGQKESVDSSDCVVLMLQMWCNVCVAANLSNKQLRLFTVPWWICTHRLCRCIWYEHDGPENKALVARDSPGLCVFCCSAVCMQTDILCSVIFGTSRKKLLTSYHLACLLLPGPHSFPILLQAMHIVPSVFPPDG
jgi:hypothetical protein